MKVFVIEKGFYSDRRVIGVVDSEEKAEFLCKNLCGNYDDSDDVSYTEFDTEQFKINKGFRYIVEEDEHGIWSAEWKAERKAKENGIS